MKKIKRQLSGFKLALMLLVCALCTGSAKAQTYTYYGFADANGDGLGDWHYFTSNGYISILHGIPGGAWPTGTQVRWTNYYVGFGYTFITGSSDLDGQPGGEVAVWQPTGTAIIVITDRTLSKKGYNTGAQPFNSWIACANNLQNLDGQPGLELMIFYFNRSPISKRGSMIIHRTQSTRATWSCTNLTRQQDAGGNDVQDEMAGATVYDGSQETFLKNPELKPPPGWSNPADGKHEITIFPSPARNVITLQTDDPAEIIQTLVITDNTGRVVLTGNSNSRSVDVGAVKSGFYFVKVQTNKKSYAGRLIKE